MWYSWFQLVPTEYSVISPSQGLTIIFVGKRGHLEPEFQICKIQNSRSWKQIASDLRKEKTAMTQSEVPLLL